MTRERAKELAPIIIAYSEGKTIQWKPCERDEWEDSPELGFYADYFYRIRPEPKRRAMTRNEVLGFICNTTGIVVRFATSQWSVPGSWNYEDICAYEWATINAKGNISEPYKFEVEE